jgi:hypothetical protein
MLKGFVLHPLSPLGQTRLLTSIGSSPLPDFWQQLFLVEPGVLIWVLQKEIGLLKKLAQISTINPQLSASR